MALALSGAALTFAAETADIVLINGKVHNYWRIDPDRLRSALTALL